MNTNIQELIVALERIIANLKVNAYPNESAISTGVILRVLHLLGWDVYDPDFVWPEYTAGGGRVDFALCFPEKTPVVFIEVKQAGKVLGADKQLFEYAFHQGTPFAVLCDGKTWGFYLPAEQGTYEERRVYKLDLLERAPKESAEKLILYLDFERTKTGKALAQAKADHQDITRRTLSKQTIPKAWKDLVEGEDPSILERIASEVEGKCGIRPVEDDVIEFLQGLGVPKLAPTPPPMSHSPPPLNAAGPAPPTKAPHQRGFQLNGYFTPCRTGVEVMIGVLKALATADSNFPEKCHNDPRNAGKIRTYIASGKAELYPGRPDLEEFSDEFASGWFVATNLSNNLKAKVIRLAFGVAGLTENVNARFYL